jgi:hypothetical protein
MLYGAATIAGGKRPGNLLLLRNTDTFSATLTGHERSIGEKVSVPPTTATLKIPAKSLNLDKFDIPRP